MKKAGLEKFSEDVLESWLILYDGDPDKAYMFDDFEKVLASVESSVRGYIGEENPGYDAIFDNLVGKVRDQRDAPVIPLRVNDLFILIYRWEWDKTHVLHKLLCKCYDVVDDDLRIQIDHAFRSH